MIPTPHRPPRSPLFALSIVLGLPAGAPAQWVTPPANVPGVERRTFPSASAGTTVSYHVYAPPAYAAEPARRFPVLYWLHGSGGVITGIGPVTNWFSSAMAQGKVPPMLIVFPNGMPYGMWCDSKNGVTPIESVVVRDLIPHIDGTFRTIPARNGRILEGFSMGGYGAARFAFKFERTFAGVSMLGAGPLQLDFLDAPPGSTIPMQLREQIFADVYGSDPAYFLAQSPWVLAQDHAGTIVGSGMLVRHLIGQLDVLLDDNHAFHDHLVALGIAHQYWAAPGVGHDALGLLGSLGESNWGFYRGALALPPGPCAADIAEPADGTVDTRDLLVLLGSFGQGTAPGAAGDVNYDGVVNTSDLILLLNGFGTLCG